MGKMMVMGKGVWLEKGGEDATAHEVRIHLAGRNLAVAQQCGSKARLTHGALGEGSLLVTCDAE